MTSNSSVLYQTVISSVSTMTTVVIKKCSKTIVSMSRVDCPGHLATTVDYLTRWAKVILKLGEKSKNRAVFIGFP